MKDYIGKECTYCNKKISSTDEVVSCSECEVVHHKECWYENNGCTTSGCSGKIMKVLDMKNKNVIEKENEKKSNHTTCQGCGFENTIDSKFCSKCGAETNNDTQKYSELAKYIGKKSEYYIFSFKKMDRKKSEFSWNWSAFLFSTYWCFYRKLYTFGFVLLFLNLAIDFLPMIKGVLGIVSIFIPLAFGAFGNSIYLKHIQEIADNKELEKGGTNRYAVLAVALLLLMVYTIT